MDRFEFGKDLDGYLSRRSRRQRGSFFKSFSQKKQEVVETEEYAPVTVQQPVEIAHHDATTASEYESEKKWVVSRMFGWFAGEPEALQDVQPEQVLASNVEEIVKADMKELARISVAVFRELPVHKIRAFKQSSDFAQFKSILKKHGLSRE